MMKAICALLFTLALVSAPAVAQPLHSSTSVPLIMLVPETQSLSIVLNPDGTATATVTLNLLSAPRFVGVENGGVVYQPLCDNEPACPTSPRMEAKIEIPKVQTNALGFVNFTLVVETAVQG
jgi:hypothetical protein